MSLDYCEMHIQVCYWHCLECISCWTLDFKSSRWTCGQTGKEIQSWKRPQVHDQFHVKLKITNVLSLVLWYINRLRKSLKNKINICSQRNAEYVLQAVKISSASGFALVLFSLLKVPSLLSCGLWKPRLMCIWFLVVLYILSFIHCSGYWTWTCYIILCTVVITNRMRMILFFAGVVFLASIS